MNTILVLNTKGGSGKTTIATNLASLFATGGINTALMDYDPQGSSMHWESMRSRKRTAIHIINAGATKNKLTRIYQLKMPADTERVIIDAPAGTSGLLLQEIIERTNTIIIPVAPSPIDIHATSDFISDLLMNSKIKQRGIQICVIANRVRRDTPLYQPLQRFLKALSIPFITTLTDTENYIIAAEEGIGIHEMDEKETTLEREQWLPLLKWLACPTLVSQKKTSSKKSNTEWLSTGSM